MEEQGYLKQRSVTRAGFSLLPFFTWDPSLLCESGVQAAVRKTQLGRRALT